MKQWTTEDGMTVIRIHHTADPGKNPATMEGATWLARTLKGYPGGQKGKNWKSEMDIDFSVYGGKAVVPSFNEEIHVAKERLIPVKGLSILRGWDTGLTPACSFTQIVPGPYWYIFEGLSTAHEDDAVGMNTFGPEVVEYSNLMYPGWKFLDYGDPALYQRSQADLNTAAAVLRGLGIVVIPGEVGSLSRDDTFRVQFERLVNGRPFVQVCPTAITMIEGLKGGFQYKRIAQTNMYLTEHEKNDISHVLEGCEYTASRIFKSSDPKGRDQAVKKKKRKSVMDRKPNQRR
jgi:hypothetical protein